jgi:hypothetical protein
MEVIDKIPPRRAAALRKQLAAANERLVALEREQRELRKTVTDLVAQLDEERRERATPHSASDVGRL